MPLERLSKPASVVRFFLRHAMPRAPKVQQFLQEGAYATHTPTNFSTTPQSQLMRDLFSTQSTHSIPAKILIYKYLGEGIGTWQALSPTESMGCVGLRKGNRLTQCLRGFSEVYESRPYTVQICVNVTRNVC